jgi:PPOX class probable F420-dependent enzyme
MRAERPGFTPGYGIASDEIGLLDWTWAEQRLVAARNYWVTTTRDDGRPHAAPVWGLWHDGTVVFSTDPHSVKGHNLAARPDVVVHLESGDEAVVIEGRAMRVTDSSELRALVAAYVEKYGPSLHPDNPDHAVYRVQPDRVLAWREKDFPTSATRFRP